MEISQVLLAQSKNKVLFSGLIITGLIGLAIALLLMRKMVKLLREENDILKRDIDLLKLQNEHLRGLEKKAPDVGEVLQEVQESESTKAPDTYRQPILPPTLQYAVQPLPSPDPDSTRFRLWNTKRSFYVECIRDRNAKFGNFRQVHQAFYDAWVLRLCTAGGGFIKESHIAVEGECPDEKQLLSEARSMLDVAASTKAEETQIDPKPTK